MNDGRALERHQSRHPVTQSVRTVHENELRVIHVCLLLETNKCRQCHGCIDFALTTVTVGCFIDSREPCQSVVELCAQ